MIRYNTRFCPTLNGYLHLGHLYMMLVNQAEAYKTDGKFIVRLDDTQAQWNAMFSAWQLMDFRDTMRADLDWFGIEPDVWSAQSGLMDLALALAEDADYHMPEMDLSDYVAPVVVGSKVSYYPGDERLTVEHVLMDWIEQVNLVIRGIDLITEACAYTILRKRFRLPQVQQVYIPRLDFPGDEVSKTRGNFKLKSFREVCRYPEGIINALARDCLIDWRGKWTFDNVKSQPVLGAWAKELTYGVPA